MKYQVKPIGVVRNGIAEKDTIWEEVESEIVLDDEYAESLTGLDEFSHVIVTWWLHESRGYQRGVFRPRGWDEFPEVGTFATRSPRRPNPIGITVVKLLGIDGPRVRVLGLDAIDGTPVLDVKPYIHYGDRVEDTRVPEWIRRFNEEKLYEEEAAR